MPHTRSGVGLPPLDISKEDKFGSRVTEEVKKEMWGALGDSPIGAVLGAACYLVSLPSFTPKAWVHMIDSFQLGGWPAYILTNASGQKYPKGSNRK